MNLGVGLSISNNTQAQTDKYHGVTILSGGDQYAMTSVITQFVKMNF